MDVIVTLFGLVFGSFYNVVVYRLPRGESLVMPPSHCPQCGHRLGAVDLVPVLSFLWLRGRCRSCGAAISWRYPLIEALTGFLFWLGYRLFGLTIGMPLFWLGASLALVATLLVLERRPWSTDENGLTLVETLAALAILGIVVVAVMGLYTASARAQRDAVALSDATSLAQSVLEGARYMAAQAPSLPSLPPQWSDFTVSSNGTPYRVRISATAEDESPTLTRVAVHVEWSQGRPESIDLTTLVTGAAAGGPPGQGGGPGNNNGNGGDGNNGNSYGNGGEPPGQVDNPGNAYGNDQQPPGQGDGTATAAAPTWDWLGLLAQ